VIKNDCVFFEHNKSSADKIRNDEHPEKMRFLYEGLKLSQITGQDLNPSSTSPKFRSSCKMSYAILNKRVGARDASELVKAVFINWRATDPRVSAT